MSDSQQPYRVLARKYRPRTFGELIGQDAMVQTLANAIRRGRLAHAFLMTGVRGVGKTSTARLIAKALNCVGPDGQGGPTIDPCGVCEPCRAIAEGRHIDIIEMDAASHTGIDDVREIIEAVRYAAVSARFKMYIIDEAHMLSKQAWNGLLKTLEEPPEHVKFLFATTEVTKVPVTVLSRCQRFDLRRIPADKLMAHFTHVVEAEEVAAEPEALTLVARAAEGSARDGLSILDQAIAHADLSGDRPLVTAAQVREMLGLSDRGAVGRLMAVLLEGDAQALLAAVREQYDLGVEPLSIFRGLMEMVHGATLVKVGKGGADPSQSEEERERLADWASQLGFPALHRIWQLLLKGHDEVASAVLPLEACEMALLRIVHAASMPDPSDIARMIAGGGMAGGSAPAETQGGGAGNQPQAAAPTLPPTFEAMIDLLWSGAGMLADQVEHEMRLIDYAPPMVSYEPTPGLPDDFRRRLGEALKSATGVSWQVVAGEGRGAPTLAEQKLAAMTQTRQGILETDIVKAALEAFPDAELVEETERWSASA